MKNDETPAVVERIVNDIDAIVRVVKFPDGKPIKSGERTGAEVTKKSLVEVQTSY